ncbi:MAG: hypothetical protein MIO92_15355, partial [Methanosarcinaceae archaeon]|nr:hypothetical protein [Methanosarcinaceae archaeon]
MAKNVHDDVLDAALNVLKTLGTKLVILNAEPTGASAYTNAQTNADSSGYRLAEVSITSADYTGPAEGDTSGRKIQVNLQTSLSVDGVASSDTANYVSIVQYHASSVSLQNVLYTTTCTPQVLSGGNKVNTPDWDIEIRDPS